MGNAFLTPQAAKEIEESFDLTEKAWEILKVVTAEWESDPTSVQCFDLRIVQEAKRIVKRREELKLKNPLIN